MVVIGASWLLFWLLIDPLKVEMAVAALITGIGFVVLGFILGERPLPIQRA